MLPWLQEALFTQGLGLLDALPWKRLDNGQGQWGAWVPSSSLFSAVAESLKVDT